MLVELGVTNYEYKVYITNKTVYRGNDCVDGSKSPKDTIECRRELEVYNCVYLEDFRNEDTFQIPDEY